MKRLSDRTDSLVQSEIRAISKRINEVNGINLGQGICDMPTPEPIRRAAKAAIDANKSIYSNYAGVLTLRHHIRDKAAQYNKIPLSSIDDIVVSVGSTGAFVTTVLTLLNDGDEVVLFEPFYGYHTGLLQALGAKMRFVTMRGNDWDVDFDEVRAAVGPGTKAILITTPGNPHGKVWTREELQRILDIAVDNDLYVITDEIYEYMLYDGRVHTSLASLPDAYKRTVTLSGFSKTYNMTGWRLGYAIAPEHIAAKMGLLNDLIYICAPTPLQHGVAAAFEMDPSYFDRLAKDYADKRELMCRTLEEIGFSVPWPQGAYYVLASFEPLSSKEAFSNDRRACDTLIEQAGVGTVRGGSFFSDPEDGKYYLRFCFAKESDVLQDACDRLLRAFR